MTNKTIKSVVEIKDVTKTYILRHEKPTLIENILYRSKKDIHEALKKVSFSIYEGERVGVIGRNGSGKTTLLKLIAGITTQQKGDVKVDGRVVSLIDLESGFHPDLTGEENIFLNGLMVGMNKKEIENKKQSIIKFADIGKFIDSPLYTYSSGMKLRLGFSIAIHSNPDILLLDEDFAVGDEIFRNKANKEMSRFKKEKQTLVMASHWLEELERNCNKFIWLEKGSLVEYGGKEVLRKYKDSFSILKK